MAVSKYDEVGGKKASIGVFKDRGNAIEIPKTMPICRALLLEKCI